MPPGLDAMRTACAATSLEDRTVGCAGGFGAGGGAANFLIGLEAGPDFGIV
jgi:hypothetical protein